MNTTHALIAVAYFLISAGVFAFRCDSNNLYEPLRQTAFIALFWPLVLVIEVCRGGYEYFKGEGNR